MFTVYGLRIRGDREARYIGQTNGYLDLRLQGHLTAAQRGRHNPELCRWLLDNTDQIEAFKIGYVDTRKEALAMERAIIALCLRLGQRLLNQRSLPVVVAQDEAA